MTDLGNRLSGPTRIGDLLHLVARTDWDGQTNEASTHLPANSETNATPAGGSEDLPSISHGHDHSPHVYFVYWPELGIAKAGISEKARWQRWASTGAVMIATADVCCMSHARSIESDMHDALGVWGAKAFQSGAEATVLLGGRGGGWTECYRLIQSSLRGEHEAWPYDYERAYGLIVPPNVNALLEAYEFARHPIESAVAARGATS